MCDCHSGLGVGFQEGFGNKSHTVLTAHQQMCLFGLQTNRSTAEKLQWNAIDYSVVLWDLSIFLAVCLVRQVSLCVYWGRTKGFYRVPVTFTGDLIVIELESLVNGLKMSKLVSLQCFNNGACPEEKWKCTFWFKGYNKQLVSWCF